MSQARLTFSPLGMATVAAAIDSGADGGPVDGPIIARFLDALGSGA